jgi:hypothetical protein
MTESGDDTELSPREMESLFDFETSHDLVEGLRRAANKAEERFDAPRFAALLWDAHDFARREYVESDDSDGRRKVVLNRKHGGFGLSEEAIEMLIEEFGWEVADSEENTQRTGRRIRRSSSGGRRLDSSARRDKRLRTDPALVEVVETLGDDASGRHADLQVVEIPGDVEWTIDEYDGVEWVAETHRTWP